MLTINHKPAVSGVGIHNRIVLTDNAYSEVSIVHMDKKDAPFQDTFVWVAIKDPHEPGNMLGRWMYVQHVMFEDYADPILRDEYGEPVLDGMGMPTKKTKRNDPGYCKLILREHKHVLTRAAFQDSFNIPSLLSHVLLQYQLIEKYNSFNEVDWDGIHDLISNRGVKLITSGSDRPPILPVNMNWRGIYLADGLDDLLYNFSCRVIEEPEVVDPDNEYLKNLNHQSPPLLTNLVWRKRQFVDLPDDIIYDSITWPEESNVSRYTEINTNRVVFSESSNRDFERLDSPSPGAGMLRLRCDKVIAGGDRTEIRNWLNETFINVNLFYAFVTRRLPASFVETQDWSKIEYVFTDNDFFIQVRHEPRPVNRLPHPILTERKETFTGRVTSSSPGSITITDIRNDSNTRRDIYLSDSYTLPIGSNVLGGVSIVGKDVTFQIANNTVTLLSTSSLYSPYSDAIKLLPYHDGEEVTKIIQYIEYLNYACDDEKISLGLDPIFDYKYLSHTVDPRCSTDFNRMEWEVINNEPNAFNLTLDTDALPSCRVVFEMKATREELITYLETQPAIAELGPAYIEAIADFWLSTFKQVDMIFSWATSPSVISWKVYYNSEFANVPFGTGFYSNIRTDIDSELFTGPRGVSKGPTQSFPLIFPDPGVRVTGAAVPFLTYGLNVPGWNYDILRQELAKRYIANHLETFVATFNLEYA